MEGFNPYEGQEGELKITFDWKGEEYQIEGLTPDHTCNKLLSKIAEKLNGCNSNGKSVDGSVFNAFEYMAQYKQKRLVGDTKLRSKGMTGGGVTYITVFLDSDGGTLSVKSTGSISIDTKTRNISFKNHSQIPKVTGKCIMYGDKDELCAKMTECDCLISPSGMRGIINFVLQKNTFTRIYCPVCYVNKKKYIFWPYEKCLYIGNITGETRDIIAKVFHRRYQKGSGTFKLCPKCLSRNKKKSGVTKYRINCASCKVDFCFRCQKPWKRGGFLVCGNEECPTVQKQNLLTNCDSLSKDNGRSWVSSRKEEIPSRRACPKCYNLTMHRKACPHVKCTACGTDFCWICLIPEYYAKGHNTSTCKLHHKQILG